MNQRALNIARNAVFGVVWLLMATACTSGVRAGDQIAFDTLDQGRHSLVQEPSCLVITDSEQLAELWHRVYRVRSAEPPISTVDFERYSVVAVFQGEQPTGGYSIGVQHITRSDTRLTVEVTRSTPPPDAMVTMALTSPYHIVRMPRSDHPVVFAGCR